MMFGRASAVVSEGTVWDGGQIAAARRMAMGPLRRTPAVSS